MELKNLYYRHIILSNLIYSMSIHKFAGNPWSFTVIAILTYIIWVWEAEH